MNLSLLTAWVYFFLVVNLAACDDDVDENGCVAGAVWDAKSDECACKKGYKGKGDLCCIPEGCEDEPSSREWCLKNVYKNTFEEAKKHCANEAVQRVCRLSCGICQATCMVSGDPFIHTPYGAVFPVNIPCTTQLTMLSNDNCSLTVYGASEIQERGMIFYTQLQIVMSKFRQNRTFIRISAQNISILSKESSPRVVTFDKDGKAKIVIAQEPVTIREYNTGLKTVSMCGAKIAFRPRQQNDTMKASPGACLRSPKNIYRDGGLCSFKLRRDEERNSLVTSAVKSVLNANGVLEGLWRFSEPKHKAECDQYRNLACFKQGKINHDLLNKCGPILNNGRIRLCLDIEGAGEEKLFKLFIECLKTFCPGNTDYKDFKGSKAIRRCIPSMTFN